MSQDSLTHSQSIRVGFVPLVDCAPLVIAFEEGIFAEAGLTVELMREPGWASIRDKIVYGELDAAHSLVGLCFAISWGLGVLGRPCVTGFLFNSNGDAITVSRQISELGVTNAASLAKKAGPQMIGRPLKLGVPHLYSSHHFLLRQWLQPAGLKPGVDIEIVVIPPGQMVPSLESGFIDGFCVGEPYNTLAAHRNSGVVLKESAELSPMHPEKALLVTEAFAESRSEEHETLILCLIQAAELCDTKEGRNRAAELLSKEEYLGTGPEMIRESLFAGSGSMNSDDFHLFNRFGVNEPTADRANWVVSHMRSAGLIAGSVQADRMQVSSIFREDIYANATARSKKNVGPRKVTLP